MAAVHGSGAPDHHLTREEVLWNGSDAVRRLVLHVSAGDDVNVNRRRQRRHGSDGFEPAATPPSI